MLICVFLSTKGTKDTKNIIPQKAQKDTKERSCLSLWGGEDTSAGEMEDGVAVWEGVGEGGAGEEDLAVGVEEREEVELTAGVEFADDVIDEEGDIGGGELLSDDVEAGEFECEGGHATFAGGAEVDEGSVVEEAGQAGAVGAAVGVAVSAVAFELLV